jgi:hypothetical protein
MPNHRFDNKICSGVDILRSLVDNDVLIGRIRNVNVVIRRSPLILGPIDPAVVKIDKRLIALGSRDPLMRCSRDRNHRARNV